MKSSTTRDVTTRCSLVERITWFCESERRDWNEILAAVGETAAELLRSLVAHATPAPLSRSLAVCTTERRRNDVLVSTSFSI